MPINTGVFSDLVEVEVKIEKIIFEITHLFAPLSLRLEDRLHLGTNGRCSRSEVKQMKINRDLFCISLDLHYL